MKLQYTRARKTEAGFIQGALIVGLALLAAVIATFALSGRTKNITPEQARAFASAVVEQGNKIKEGFVVAQADGFNADRVSLDLKPVSGDENAAGLFNVEFNWAVEQIAPEKAALGINGQKNILNEGWSYSTGTVIPGVGTAAPETVVTIAGLSQEVCQRINASLYNTLPTAIPGASTYVTADQKAPTVDGRRTASNAAFGAGPFLTDADVEAVADANLHIAENLGLVAAQSLAGAELIDGKTEGCVASADPTADGFVYFKVILER